MKIIYNHRNNDEICDILLYLYEVCNNKDGMFFYVHPKSYKLWIEKSIPESGLEYDGVKFFLKYDGPYIGINGTIDRYRELIVEGEQSKITKLINYVMKHVKDRIDGSVIKGKLNIFTYNFYSWKYDECLNKKSKESINLPKNQIDEIMNDVKTFISEKTQNKYESLELSHCRSYMFYGPPGTGKTTLIRYIASEIDYSIGIINFDDNMDDNMLKTAISKRPSNCILVFEDIDCLFESRKHSDTYSTKVTFSGLLNALDGIICQKNLIMIFTTNHIEILDNALKRRIDNYVKFDFATKFQIKSMYEKFYNNSDFDSFYQEIKHLKLTPNVIQKFFTKHLFDDINKYTNEFKEFATGEISQNSDKITQNIYT